MRSTPEDIIKHYSWTRDQPRVYLAIVDLPQRLAAGPFCTYCTTHAVETQRMHCRPLTVIYVLTYLTFLFPE